jgi:hypothetical protein
MDQKNEPAQEDTSSYSKASLLKSDCRALAQKSFTCAETNHPSQCKGMEATRYFFGARLIR